MIILCCICSGGNKKGKPQPKNAQHKPNDNNPVAVINPAAAVVNDPAMVVVNPDIINNDPAQPHIQAEMINNNNPINPSVTHINNNPNQIAFNEKSIINVKQDIDNSITPITKGNNNNNKELEPEHIESEIMSINNNKNNHNNEGDNKNKIDNMFIINNNNQDNNNPENKNADNINNMFIINNNETLNKEDIVLKEKNYIIDHGSNCVLCDSKEGEVQVLCTGRACIKCYPLIEDSLVAGDYRKCKICSTYIVGLALRSDIIKKEEEKFNPSIPNCVYCNIPNPTAIVPCNGYPDHLLHEKCLLGLIKRKENCPMCKTKLNLNYE